MDDRRAKLLDPVSPLKNGTPGHVITQVLEWASVSFGMPFLWIPFRKVSTALPNSSPKPAVISTEPFDPCP